MYGTRDAASILGDIWSDVLNESSMNVGNTCPAFFCSHNRDFKGLCHGDKLCSGATETEKRFEVKQTGYFGFASVLAEELKVLNRTTDIDVLNDEVTLEPDTKLVEGASGSMKLHLSAKGVDSPRVRRNEEQKQHRSRIPRNSHQRNRLCRAAW